MTFQQRHVTIIKSVQMNKSDKRYIETEDVKQKIKM